MNLRENFLNPGSNYSAVPLWFLNGELDPQILTEQMDEMAEKGVYGAFLHPRAYFKTPYLEKEWWEVVDHCVKHGKEIGFHTWLYDEYAWPSGTAGSVFEDGYQKPSRVLAEGEGNMAKALEVKVYEGEWEEIKPGLFSQLDENTVKAIFLAGEEEGYTCIFKEELTPCGAQYGLRDKLEKLQQEEKRENVKILVFSRKLLPRNVDYLNKSTIRRFMELTHEEYAKRYEAFFGTVIPGIFFDEIFMASNPLPWTDSLPEEFKNRFGYDLLEELPALVEEGKEHERQVRKDYYSLLAFLYEEAFFKPISKWCEAHHLSLTGHTEENLNGHPVRQGNYFDTMRHLHIPGADCHDYRYRLPRKITYWEPKYSVSVARAYNRKRCLSEAMGGAGWGCSLQEFKRGINTMGAMGINMYTLHGFYYECSHQGSQADWPTSFFYQNPYWKYFKIFGDYISRVSYMNTVGRPAVDIGLFYPIEEAQENAICGGQNAWGRAVCDGFQNALTALLENQLDTDMIDSRSIVNGEIKDGRLMTGSQSFAVLVFPAGIRLPEEVKNKLEEFLKAGGYLVFYQCGEDRKPFNIPGSFSVCQAEELPGMIEKLLPRSLQLIRGSKAELFINHRKAEDSDIYFISNSSSRRREITLKLDKKGKISRMYPESGRCHPVPYMSSDNSAVLELELESDEGTYLLIEKEDGFAGEQACMAEWSEEQAVCGTFSFLPLSGEYDRKWGCDAKYCRLEIPVAVFSSELHENSEQIRICNTAGEAGSCGRHLSRWHAKWIARRGGWNDNCSAGNLYFRKTFHLDREPEEVRICLAAVKQYTLYINGILAGQGRSDGQAVTLEVSPYFHKGDNLIAVWVQNDTPAVEDSFTAVEVLDPGKIISLLLQAEIRMGEESVTITSDNSWLVSLEAEKGWETEAEDPQAAKINYTKLTNLSQRRGWLYAWERGSLPLHPWGELPLFGKKVAYPVEITYSITLPAGTVLLEKPETEGQFTYTLDGRPICWQGDEKQILADGHTHNFQLTGYAANTAQGLKKPVQVTVAPIQVPIGDWRLHGLEWFSGRCMYKNTFTAQKGKQYRLDMGQVCYSAEVWINGILAGTRIWEPYSLDITGQVRDGENEIVLVVANSAAVERRWMLVDEGEAIGWNHYWNKDNLDREGEDFYSGLLGPVRIFERKESL